MINLKFFYHSIYSDPGQDQVSSPAAETDGSDQTNPGTATPYDGVS